MEAPGRPDKPKVRASGSRQSSKPRRASRRSDKREAARASQYVELEVSSDEERRDRDKRMAMLAAAFGTRSDRGGGAGGGTKSGGIGAAATAAAFRRRSSCPYPTDTPDGSRSSSSDTSTGSPAMATAVTAPVTPVTLAAPLVPRDRAFRLVRRGSDPLVNDEFYATQMQVGNFVKMGWLTKQGHAWKTWKTRFFVLFSDGTFAYYKSKGRKKIQGCIQLNDGVVSVQHVDVRKSDKAYVFQVEKGFYKLICYCCSQFEAELWVTALRAVRRAEPPCFEIDLTPQEEKAGSNAVSRHLNKIFIADKHIADRVAEFKSSEFDHSFVSIQNFIVELDDIVIDRYHLEFYQDEAIEMLPGNDLVRLIRRNVEDRIFLPLYSAAYASLETYYLRVARGRTLKNLKVFKSKAQEYFGVPADLAHVYDWMDIVMMINTLDCVSLPTHKLEIIVAAGKLIAETIARSNGKFFELADETLAAIFRYVVSRSSLDDLPILRALLKTCYVYHPACQNNTNVVEAFLDAIKWIEGFEVGGGGEDADRLDPWTIAASRVSVTISTNDVGIQLTTDGNGRGAIVYNIRKQSQAALSASIVPGLALIAINQESVVLMPFSDVVRKLRTAPLPKRLTFMTEFYYYQLLSLDAEMFQYLTCLAASRGDSDSLAWMRGWCHVDLNQICSWEKARGKQIFGFEPTSGKGTPLHAAAHNGQSVMVKHLLGMGADPNICNRKLKRPLHVVKQSLDMALIIQLLVDSGADIDAPQQKGLTPLMSMCVRGSLEGAATLLALGANIHRVAWSNGFSALEFAVYGGFVDIVELCLSKGADPNGATLEGETSLHLAASTGHSDMLMCLLQNGANPNARNRFGQTPLGVLLNAAPQLDRETVTFCVDVLVSSGCRLDTRDIFGRQASHDMMILGNESIASAVSELTHESSIDIFGCCPDDYSQPALNESDLHDIAGAKAANFWRVGGAKSSVSPRSVEEVIEAIVGTGTLDLADLMAFVLFLDSFSSMNEVLECVNNHVKHRQNGYGLIRLYVLLLINKQGSSNKTRDQEERLLSVISQVLAVDISDLAAMVREYEALYRRCFRLFGLSHLLIAYATLPSKMEKLYSSSDSCAFDPALHFSRRFHQHVEAEEWAEHCTLVTHALFCSIPVRDFTLAGSKQTHSSQFVAAKRWFQHLSAYVVNAVLSQDSAQDRAEIITFFLAAAEHFSVLHNYDSLAAILYALQSTAVQRLRRTIECMSVEAKKLMNRMQILSDKGCREMNRLMRKAPNPSMPYIGLYLQNFVGLNELPIFDSVGAVNTSRLHKMGELLVEISHRQAAPYALHHDESIDALLHVSLPYESEESRYLRSLELEPREAGAIPLSDRGSYVAVQDLDIENEVRESIGGEGTFGLRQWFRKHKLVQRNRSRSSVVALYEWV